MRRLPLGTLDRFLDARVLAENAERVLDLIDRRVTERVPAALPDQRRPGCAPPLWTRVIVPRSPSPNCWTRA